MNPLPKQKQEELLKKTNLDSEIRSFTIWFRDVATFLVSEGFMVLTQELPEGMDGYIAVNINETELPKKIITVSGRLEFIRARFTYMHEYAHYLLSGKGETFAFREDGTHDIQDERNADFIARSLLMPKNEIVTIIKSEELGVSEMVVRISLKYKVTKKKAAERIIELAAA
jgi:hypothetical protein